METFFILWLLILFYKKKIERKEGKRQREFFKQKKVREVEIDVAERTKRRKLRITNFRSFLAKKNIKKKSSCLAFMTAKQREIIYLIHSVKKKTIA